MFETRVKILLVILLFAGAVIVARLADMQIVHAENYRQQAEDALLLPVKVLPAVRGRILDRLGEELVADEPCWDVRIDYGILAMDPANIAARVIRYGRQHRYGTGLTDAQIEQRLRAEIDAMWADLARFTHQPVDELHTEAAEICERVQKIHEKVAEGRGFDAQVREERMPHTIVAGLDDQAQVTAREMLGKYPWVTIEDSTRRGVRVGPAFAHVLGRLGPVPDTVRASDPFESDPLRSYEPFDQMGVAGVEAAAEKLLRGSRGRFQATRSDEVVEDTPPHAGADVHLAIRRDLQERLFDLLHKRSSDLPDHPGGAIVVLDVPTRECLAMVSYPAFDLRTFREDYDNLRHDTRGQPLRFRAVANRYAPGSIVKPLACLAALNAGAIDLGTHFTCTGALFPDKPSSFRCWADPNGVRSQHGSLDVVGAIKHSCNIFMYHAGELAGIPRLTEHFDYARFGKTSGTGLIEEVDGINPTVEYLAKQDRAPAAGLARQFAIGQADVSITVVQAANLAAVYASGAYKQITLVREMNHPETWTLPGRPAFWDAIREGMYDVVNERDGTAYAYAFMPPEHGYALCGKTGSAQAIPWPVSYSVVYAGDDEQERVAIIPASTRDDAISDFVRTYGDTVAFEDSDVSIHERWPSRPPEPGRTHSHAWFAGFLQPLDAAGKPDWQRPPRIAFAVLIEFGGSGGRTSGPLGRDVAEAVIDVLGPALDPDAPPAPAPPKATARTASDAPAPLAEHSP